MSGGGRTSLGGKVLENVIRSMKLRGFTMCSPDELHTARSDMFSDTPRMLVKNYPYVTLFGTQGRREYYICSREWEGQLECKFQNTGGSVDEKMVYLTETLRRSSGTTGMVLVYGGEYWTAKDRGRSVIEWVKKEARNIKREGGKDFLCFDFDEFLDWVGKTFK